MRELLLKNKEQLDYFKNIVKGHTNLEIRELFYNKFNIELTEQQVNNQKRKYKLKSGVKCGFEPASTKNPNYKPVGYEHTTPDGYILVKVAQPGTYRFKHHLIWEEANGKIPEDCYIMFLDGDRTNFSLDNLKLIKKNDLRTLISNRLTFKNKELTETGILIAQLKNKKKEKIEMANIWKRLNKMNKSNYEISQETNIPEEKVEEIMKGQRQVPTDRVDDFRKALATNNRAEKSLKLSQVRQWYNTTDLKQRREDLGYKSQASLARAMNVSASTISRIESKLEENSKYYNEDTLIKYYDFMTDDLNKVIINNKNKKERQYKNMTKKERNIDFEEVKKWYKDFDLRKWLEDRNWHHGDLARALGYKSSSSITDVINGRRTIEQSKNVLTKLYVYVKEEETQNNTPQVIEEDEDIEVLDEPNVGLNMYTGEYEDITGKEIKLPTYPEVEVNVEAERVYKMLDKAEEEIQELEDANERFIKGHELKNNKIMRLEYELEEARKQIARYEKLIDMIGVDKC